MAAKPFESRIQDLVYNLDVGLGLKLVKGGLYILFVIVVISLYTATQFFGFRTPDAMDYAQLGRNVERHGELVTQIVRPVTMRHLIEHKRHTVERDGEPREISGDPRVERHPDIVHAPLFPSTLGAWFRILGTEFPQEPEPGKYGPELTIVALNHILSVLTGLLIWMLGRRLFEPRIGFLSMTVFFLSDAVWRQSISGLAVTMVTLLVTASIAFAVVAVANREQGARAIRWVVPFILTGLLCVLAVLTRYGAIVIVPALALFFALGFHRRGRMLATVYVLVVLVGISPWLARNKAVSGTLLGLTPSTVMAGAPLYSAGGFERTMVAEWEDLNVKQSMNLIRVKWFSNIGRYYNNNVRVVGEGVFVCLFVTTFLYRFLRRNVHLLRWCIALAMLLLLIAAGFFGDATIGLMHMFWPVIILYGFAFYYLLLDRLKLSLSIQKMAVTTLVVLISAAPLILTLLPPKEQYPYPPYNRAIITRISTLFEPDEFVCSDMPWATAWYGDRNSLLLPQTIDEFYDINDFMHPVNGIYFTPLTRNQPFVRSLLTGRDRTWWPLQVGRIPDDFPLTHGFPLMNMDQLFLSDRDRFAEAASAEIAAGGGEEVAGGEATAGAENTANTEEE